MAGFVALVAATAVRAQPSPADGGAVAAADAGAPDAGAPEAGTPDGGAPPPLPSVASPSETVPPPPAPPPAAPPGSAYETVVTSMTPLHGSGLPRDRVPANVQTVTAEAMADRGSLDLSQHLNDAVGSVHVNHVQANPLMPDLQYRGFLSSPLLGTPQGLSVYLNGVRLNEPFGDTVSWDLVPTQAIRSVNVTPGSNPLYGLNTLGGALSIETKTGFTDPGASLRLLTGSFRRQLLGFSVGAYRDKWAVFAAGQVFGEEGWRRASPSRTTDVFVNASYRNGGATADLSLMAADTTLVGNGPAPEQLLALQRNDYFTAPDRTQNRVVMAVARGERPLGDRFRLSGSAHLRGSRTRTVNGDQAEWAECAAMAGALCAVDDDGSEVAITDGAGNPVAFDDGYDAADNATHTRQLGYGASGQLATHTPIAGRENHLFLGVTGGEARIRFRSQTTIASFGPDRSTLPTSFLDPTAAVALDNVVRNLGVYASDTFALRRDLFLTASARFNVTSLSLRDQLGTELTGDHKFLRVNPAVGLSYQPWPAFGVYGAYSESARAPTAMELSCASETDPCRLPNAFVTDPPLAQVVARTVEAGGRGHWRGTRTALDYALAGFRTASADDILFISSGMVANRGFFANVGDTRRQGIEAMLTGRRFLNGAGGRPSAIDWSLHYTLLRATFETPFGAPSANHPDAVGGTVTVPAGARIPGVPGHIGKIALAWTSPFGLSAGASAVAQTGQYLRGDEANLLAPLAGYVVVNLRIAYRVAKPASMFLVVNNVFDARYASFGVLGNAGEVLGPSFDNPRFIGPGAPRAAWLGVDLKY
jgi:outer membrane receptor protein involved in Fe transport